LTLENDSKLLYVRISKIEVWVDTESADRLRFGDTLYVTVDTLKDDPVTELGTDKEASTDYRPVDEALDELHASLKYVEGHAPNEAISNKGMQRVLRTVLRILILLVKERKA
jgi:hypothetical protein